MGREVLSNIIKDVLFGLSQGYGAASQYKGAQARSAGIGAALGAAPLRQQILLKQQQDEQERQLRMQQIKAAIAQTGNQNALAAFNAAEGSVAPETPLTVPPAMSVDPRAQGQVYQGDTQMGPQQLPMMPLPGGMQARPKSAQDVQRMALELARAQKQPMEDTTPFQPLGSTGQVLNTRTGAISGTPATPKPPAMTPETITVNSKGPVLALKDPEGKYYDVNTRQPITGTIGAYQRPPASSPAANDSRLDRSYQFNVGQLNTIAKPIDDAIGRLSRLQDTINQETPQADALLAPELMTVMAGGIGSGLRINESEIARVVGGRSNMESLKAALNKWQADPTKALSVTPAQRAQMRALIGTVAQKLSLKRQILTEAQQKMVDANDVTDHRKAVMDAQQKMNKIDSGGLLTLVAPDGKSRRQVAADDPKLPEMLRAGAKVEN